MKTIRRATAAALLAALVTLGACSSDSDSGGSENSSETLSTDRAEDAPEGGTPEDGAAEDRAPEARATEQPDSAEDASGNESGTEDGTEESRSQVIKEGEVSLDAGNVEKARAQARKIIDAHDGEVSDEQTSTDSEGTMSWAQMVVRVPSDEFDAVMTQLADIAELDDTSRTAEDVTTQMIDNRVRIRAQEKSLKRIETLLARAETVQEIVSIESELTKRQSELDSLKQRQAWLSDQTSMSTVTLSIDHEEEAVDEEEGEKHNAFVAGLLGGWDALVSMGSGIASLAGALLPFAVVLAVLGAPVVALVRRARARRGPQPSAEPVEEAAQREG